MDDINRIERLMQSKMTRRTALFTAGYGLAVSTVLWGCAKSDTAQQQPSNSPQASASPQSNVSTDGKVFHVVRSKQLTALAALEKRGTLEKALEPLGFTVSWDEYLAGPQQLEALNAGSLDLALTAESPPVFSQAAGAPLVYLAALPVNGRLISLLVPTTSTAKSIADLKGKRIAFQKASIGHYLTVKALQREGLKLSDVESVFLPPPDAAAAFASGSVDAWFIWEPFVTRTVQKKIGRVLLDGGNGLRDTTNFYSTRREFLEKHPGVLKVFFEELEKTELWAKANPKAITELLVPVTQLDPAALKVIYDKTEWGVKPITSQIITKQQEVADLWFSLNLIPKKVDVKQGFLTDAEYSKVIPEIILAKV
ncbi:MAG: aliphatic sulfonate ABC transporter substrate-binding protein [Elainella sp. C42_A2020_010]|nr:aliphatic sulfonate ABC transporter substrate-binding protein [Elainella sp. C42_A2020_010]